MTETALAIRPDYRIDITKADKKQLKFLREQSDKAVIADIAKTGLKLLWNPFVGLIAAGVFLDNSDRILKNQEGRGLLTDYTATMLFAMIGSAAALGALKGLNPFDKEAE